MPQLLAEAQKQQDRIEYWLAMHEKFDGVHQIVYDIITDDESCCYYYDRETQHQSQVSVARSDPLPTKVHTQRSVGTHICLQFSL